MSWASSRPVSLSIAFNSTSTLSKHRKSQTQALLKGWPGMNHQLTLRLESNFTIDKLPLHRFLIHSLQKSSSQLAMHLNRSANDDINLFP